MYGFRRQNSCKSSTSCSYYNPSFSRYRPDLLQTIQRVTCKEGKLNRKQTTLQSDDQTEKELIGIKRNASEMSQMEANSNHEIFSCVPEQVFKKIHSNQLKSFQTHAIKSEPFLNNNHTIQFQTFQSDINKSQFFDSFLHQPNPVKHEATLQNMKDTSDDAGLIHDKCILKSRSNDALNAAEYQMLTDLFADDNLDHEEEAKAYFSSGNCYSVTESESSSSSLSGSPSLRTIANLNQSYDPSLTGLFYNMPPPATKSTDKYPQNELHDSVSTNEYGFTRSLDAFIFQNIE